MSEIFLKDDLSDLLENRFIVVIGDSIQRAVYKDIVLLLQKNQYLTDSQLRRKGEVTFSGDKLIEGGQLGEVSNGVGYREVRQYQTDYHLVRFYFVTRCYNKYVESLLTDLSSDPLPDVVVMNSCLWDISRYGQSSVDQYKKNIKRLFERFREMLPPTCLIIWNSTLPISKRARGGFLIPGVEFMNSVLRLDILEANFYVHKLAVSHGFDVLDLHYYLRHQLQRRAGDGVHWDTTAHRRITNLILTHIAEAWGVESTQHARQYLSKGFNRNRLFNNKNQLTAQSPLSLLDNPVPMQRAPLGMFANSYSNRGKHFGNRVSAYNNHGNTVGTHQNVLNNQASAFSNKTKTFGNQEMAFRNQFTDQTNALSNQVNAFNNQINFNNNINMQQQLQQVGQGFTGFEEVNRQTQFINRYGGPIRRTSNTEADNQQFGFDNNEGQFRWEPYENRHFNPSLSGNMYSDRMRPYSGRMGKRGHQY